MSNSEKTHLLTASIGEGLLIMEDDHSELKVIASPEEHKLITTNPNEITKPTFKKTKRQRKVDIVVDVNKRFFRKKDLNSDNVKFLLSKGHQVAKYKSLVSNKLEDFLLQPRHNESLTHLFVIYDLKEYLEKKGIEVKMFVTKKPDIVFERKGKKWAIEVETGSMITRKKVFEEKVKSLNKDYDKWFFVVTNKNKITDYRKYGLTIDLRFLRGQLNKILKL